MKKKYHFDLLSGEVVGQVELFKNGGSGVEPLDDECIFAFGHWGWVVGLLGLFRICRCIDLL